jgi:hypothetical protein
MYGSISHTYNLYGVVLDKCAWGAEKNDTTIRRVGYLVVTNDCRTAANADTIGPLLKFI